MGYKPKPWPSETMAARAAIMEQSQKLRQIFGVCLAEGIESKNYQLVEMMLPRIKDRAAIIQAESRGMQRHDARNRGRVPKWSEIAMDITALAGTILNMAGRLNEALLGNRYLTIQHSLVIGHRATLAISSKIDSIPVAGLAADIPLAFLEVMETLHYE